MLENSRSQYLARLTLSCAALSLSCAALTLSGCAARAQADSGDGVTAPVAVAIETAAPAGRRPLYRGPGTVVAAHTYHLGFEITGRVVGVTADLGDRVAAGQVLATLDDAEARRQLQASEARAASAEAQAARAENGARPAERAAALASVAGARASLARARAAADLAHRNDERYRALAAGGDAPAQQADAAHTAAIDADQQVAAAAAQLSAAEQSAALVAAGPRDEDRLAAAADARAARAGADSAAIARDKTVLRAPAEAYVEARALEPGDLAQPGAVAFTLTAAGPPDVDVNVPEARLGGIAPGTPATVYLEGRALTARVTRIEPAADDGAHAVQVRLRLDAGSARPGAVVDVALGGRRDGDAAVPAGALLRDGGGWALETYDRRANSVRRARVRVIQSDGPRTIVAGVRAGTEIVVMGQQDARPGDAVRVVTP